MPAAVPPPIPDTSPLDGLAILLVEDDGDVREAIESLLLLEGACVIACDAAEPAIAALAGTTAIDILISDVVLGGPLSGFDVGEAAMAHRSDLPILLMTGFAGPAARDLPRPVPVLHKPFRHADLIAAILRALRTRPAIDYATA